MWANLQANDGSWVTGGRPGPSEIPSCMSVRFITGTGNNAVVIEAIHKGSILQVSEENPILLTRNNRA
jgi:hypothetical protein